MPAKPRPKQTPNPEFISLTAAATRLGVSRDTLRRRIAAGELPAYTSGRRILRVRLQDVDQLLRRVPTFRT